MTSKKRLGFFLSGQGAFLQTIINACRDGDLDTDLVFALADRPCKALERAQAAGMECYCIDYKSIADRQEFDERTYGVVSSHDVELICLFYNRIVSSKIIALHRNHIINLHPSLLPAFSGFRALDKALDAGVRYVGATTHFADELLDKGPIIAQCILPVAANVEKSELSHGLFRQQVVLILETISWFLQDRVVVNNRHVIITGANYLSYPMSPKAERFKDLDDRLLRDI